jgi:hypothetical protein
VTVNLDRFFISQHICCDEFDEWLRVRKSSIGVDLRWIVKCGSGLAKLNSYPFDNCVIDEVRLIGESTGIVSGLSGRFEDNSLIVLNSIHLNDLIEDGLIENEIENLINMCHPCIAAPIGFVLASGSLELKVMRLYSKFSLLSEVLAVNRYRKSSQ